MVFNLLKESHQEKIEAGFRLLERFFEFSTTFFDDFVGDLQLLFKTGFTNPEKKVKIASLQAFASYICNVSTAITRNFEFLIDIQFETTVFLLKNDGFLAKDRFFLFFIIFFRGKTL